MSKAADLANFIGNVNTSTGNYGVYAPASNRNFIINGAGLVNQRGTISQIGTLGQGTYNNSYGGPDRYRISHGGSPGNFRLRDSTTVYPPNEAFTKSIRVDTHGGGGTIADADFAYFNQPIEGQNLQSLKWGTSEALPVTLSFWVRSTLTGTYACGLYKTAGDRNYIKTFTTSAADTWQFVSLTFEGDVNDKIANDNTRGLEVIWGLVAGNNSKSTNSSGGWTAYGSGGGLLYGHTVNHGASFNEDLFLTGVQLEAGSKNTSFEHEPFERTLAKCQRYFQKVDDLTAGYGSGTNQYARAHYMFPVKMRAAPTSTYTYTSGGGTIGANGTHDDSFYLTFSNASATIAPRFDMVQDAEL